MLLFRKESSGPVVPLCRFDNEADAIRAANDTPFGLAAYFDSQDVRRIDRASRQLEAGIVGVNEGAVSSEAAPFGGVKESGYGREGSSYGLDDYTRSNTCAKVALNDEALLENFAWMGRSTRRFDFMSVFLTLLCEESGAALMSE
jgi:acyl-CoA reductase-like NAD-dependent aldehyde dehydrogenase